MELWTAFILGLAGSLHCAGMCGPLALALPSAGNGRTRFLLGRAAYNLGRIVTYCGLGLAFGSAGKTLVLAGVQRWLSIGLGMALLAGLVWSRRLGKWIPVASLVGQLKMRMSVLLRQRSLLSSASLGFLNGFLPCGLVYVACGGAAATASPLQGLAYMGLFGFGTVPMMLAIGVSGKLMPARLRLKLRTAVPVSVFLLGTLLILRGMALGIPFVSPDLSGAGSSCCH